MATEFCVRRNLGGGQNPEQYGPFEILDEAIAKACALLREHGKSEPVFVDNCDNGWTMDWDMLRAKCEQLTSPQSK